MLAALIAVSPMNGDPVDQWQPYIAEASARFEIPQDWIKRVMRAESGGRLTLHGRPIVSRAGAIGLMQLMPGTWDELRQAYGLGANPNDPRANILGGSAYLRKMYDQFGYPGLFAAYNAGPARYAKYLAAGAPLPSETIAYVAGIEARRPRFNQFEGTGSSQLFAIERGQPSAGESQRRTEFAGSQSLFVAPLAPGQPAAGR